MEVKEQSQEVKKEPQQSEQAQLKQLKLNVTNIKSILIKKNQNTKKTDKKEDDQEKKKLSVKKKKDEEKKLTAGTSSLKKMASSVKGALAKPGGSLFDKIMDFGLIVMTGILANALPAIKKKLEDIFTAVGKFITPVVDTIQILINAVSGPDGKVSPELEEKQIKFRQDIETAKDNLLEGIRTKLGPLAPLVDALKPLIDNLTSKFGAKLKLQTGGATLTINEAGEEGITTSEGNFVRSDFSPDQRRRYDKGDRKAYIMPAETPQSYTEEDAASAAAAAAASGSSTIIDQKNLPKLPPTGHIAGQKYGAPRDDDGDGISDRKHAGTDFDAGPNDTFYSRIGGVVMRQYETSRGYGKYVDIYNKDLNVTERIAEGDITLVNTGDKITPGTPVQRGTAQTGVFHYEIRNGKEETYGFEGTRDPVKFLNDLAKKANISSSTTPTSANITPTGNQTITADVIGQSSDDEEGLLVVVQPIVYTTA